MHKLKTAIRGSRKRDSTSSQSPRQSYESSEAASPRAEQHPTSQRQHGRSSLDAYQRSPQQGRRSRPVSAAYDDRRTSLGSPPHYVPTGYAHTHTTPSDPIDGSIANDYRSYLPALSPVDDLQGDSYMALGGNGQLTSGQSDRRHEEDVANRNIDRYSNPLDASRNKPLPVPPNPINMNQQQPHKQSTAAEPFGSAVSSIPSGNSNYTAGNAVTTRDGHVDRIRPHQEVSERTSNDLQTNGYTAQTAQPMAQLDGTRRKPQGPRSNDQRSQPPPEDRHHVAVQSSRNPADQHTVAVNGHQDDGALPDWKVQQQSLLNGVVDLRNTVDTDTDTRVAAPITHEIIKPHEHEIIQRRVYREIHNYSYYHRMQPVMHTEVLPPRHFIPNPDGNGLIEISADELPARTGKNRWWEIVQKEPQQSFEIQSRWRTEPEVIESKPYITEEGFERRETTIVYPPTLADMSTYEGLVQPVHFDHKTGQRWMGEVTTMAKLREQHDQDRLAMKELTASLPEVAPSPTVRRKPVGIAF